MTACGKAHKAHQMWWQCCGQILLTLYRDHRIVFTAEDKCRTLSHATA